jgi:hypothetical protein
MANAKLWAIADFSKWPDADEQCSFFPSPVLKVKLPNSENARGLSAD